MFWLALRHPECGSVGNRRRLPNINAVLGCAQLEQLPGFLERKRCLAEAYRERLAGIEGVCLFSE